jgi:carbonic anhydrase
MVKDAMTLPPHLLFVAETVSPAAKAVKTMATTQQHRDFCHATATERLIRSGELAADREEAIIMHRRQALRLFAGFALCPLCAAAAFGQDSHAGAHWSYEGATGPDKWGSLDAANSMCSTGTQQSPIDLTEPISARQPALEIRWSKRPRTIVNNGHTIQLNLPDGDTLKVGDRTYALVQFHFHHPSEHLVGGKAFAMEAHFVHAAADGNLAVVGVFMAPGKANAVFHKIVSTMPTQEGPPVPAEPAIDPNGLLPVRQAYYRYEGSLTTPPCSETVNWLVLSAPIEVAADDVARFAKLYPANARPVQKRNRRFVLVPGAL